MLFVGFLPGFNVMVIMAKSLEVCGVKFVSSLVYWFDVVYYRAGFYYVFLFTFYTKRKFSYVGFSGGPPLLGVVKGLV